MTDRELRFADEYLVDFDAKNAALRAGYSAKTAKNASAWIKPDNPAKPRLRELIDRRLAEMSRRSGVTAERVLRELAKVAFADVSDIVDPVTGKLLDSAERSDTAAVAGIRVKRGEAFCEYEVKLCDKMRALELLGKQIGMFAEKIQIEDAIPVVIDDVPEEDGGESREESRGKIGFEANGSAEG